MDSIRVFDFRVLFLRLKMYPLYRGGGKQKKYGREQKDKKRKIGGNIPENSNGAG